MYYYVIERFYETEPFRGTIDTIINDGIIYDIVKSNKDQAIDAISEMIIEEYDDQKVLIRLNPRLPSLKNKFEQKFGKLQSLLME